MIADRYIYAKLIADAGVAALVSTRIYPVIAPQDAVYPLITYSAVYTPADNSKNEDATHDNCAFTLRCWAGDTPTKSGYDMASDLDVAVRAALDYVDGSGAGVTAGGVTINASNGFPVPTDWKRATAHQAERHIFSERRYTT